MNQERHRLKPDVSYDVPVIVHHRGSDLPGNLTVIRRADGKYWDGRVYVSPELYMSVFQYATSVNGGFSHLSDEYFLDQVRTVFGFRFGAEFDFVSDDYRPSKLQ